MKSQSRALLWALALTTTAPTSLAQNSAETQRQYEAQQREHREREREAQKRRDEQRDHEILLESIKRDGARAPQTSPHPNSSSNMVVDAAALAAIAAAAMILIDARQPARVDQARLWLIRNTQRHNAVYESCQNNARTQAIELARERSTRLDEFWSATFLVCQCFATRAVAMFHESELQALVPYWQGAAWTNVSPERRSEAFTPCSNATVTTGLLNSTTLGATYTQQDLKRQHKAIMELEALRYQEQLNSRR